MINIINKLAILWDFDGVILDSMPVREYGFKKVLEKYPTREVNLLLDFHKVNGGLSRYVKFRYFFKEIRKEDVSEEKLSNLAKSYSDIMRKKLVSKNNLILETINFIKENKSNFNMHIVSGSDNNELNFLCDKLIISQYFKSIEGSPTPKIELVRSLIKRYGYAPENICLIGDSMNDFEAANLNSIDFYGYNNPDLKNLNAVYIKSFT
ncbi:Phosphoglycolate phosphatase, HAD superfamily [Salegentibacter holothuriorum]|uniref:phosphoglycolate phosphatase n=1 Tax=Salegentibacter holothuriorum TaxID=241145 RepID=A0A1T5APA6_9FLAO|nr:HAD hydrolase-like protein [Salegentibacter holothuriorum]SKB36657.1 Phosphoglycolate phosphatase, HAD superfamily [Salegentibacter holothuriorum]